MRGSPFLKHAQNHQISYIAKFDILWAIVEKVMQNRDQIAKRLKERTKIIQKESLMPIYRVAAILEN